MNFVYAFVLVVGALTPILILVYFVTGYVKGAFPWYVPVAVFILILTIAIGWGVSVAQKSDKTTHNTVACVPK